MSDTCLNSGTANGSSCACPPGFGGSNCAQPACGGNLFQGTGRQLVPTSSNADSFANLTAAGCSCENGWSGTNCNVCRTSNACQVAFSAQDASRSSSTAGLGLPSTQNGTLVCNDQPRVYAAGEMSCVVQVSNPMLQQYFPTITLRRILLCKGSIHASRL